jgi:hypothetical protein
MRLGTFWSSQADMSVEGLNRSSVLRFRHILFKLVVAWFFIGIAEKSH